MSFRHSVSPALGSALDPGFALCCCFSFLLEFEPTVRRSLLAEIAELLLASGKERDIQPYFCACPKPIQWPPAAESAVSFQEKRDQLLSGLLVVDACGEAVFSSDQPNRVLFGQWSHIIPGQIAVIGQPSAFTPPTFQQLIDSGEFDEGLKERIQVSFLKDMGSLKSSNQIAGLNQPSFSAQPITDLAGGLQTDSRQRMAEISRRLMQSTEQWLNEKKAQGKIEMAQVVLPKAASREMKSRESETRESEQGNAWACDRSSDQRLFLDAGFRHLADLDFMVSPELGAGQGLEPGEKTAFEREDGFIANELWREVGDRVAVEVGAVTEETFQRWVSVLEATYEESKDAPELTGKRSILQTLIGYCHSGNFQPKGWARFRQKGKEEASSEDQGCVILCDHQESAFLELVYFGVAREARGQGLGGEIFRFIHQTARSLNKDRVIAAVDSTNRPAIEVYKKFGYQKLDQKSVLVSF